MKKFLVLYCASPAVMDEAMKNMASKSEEEVMKPWTDWRDSHTANIVDFGAPLGRNKRVMGGNVTDVRNDVNGYSIIQAESHEAAAELMKDSPNFGMQGAYIEVLPIASM